MVQGWGIISFQAIKTEAGNSGVIAGSGKNEYSDWEDELDCFDFMRLFQEGYWAVMSPKKVTLRRRIGNAFAPERVPQPNQLFADLH